MTFSLVARCTETGMFGVAISSSSPAVAARCSYARAGVGAVASQNVTDPTLGPMALDLMERGLSAPEAVAVVQTRGRFIEYRQVLAVDRNGRTAIHSGPNALGIWAEARAENVAAGGNLLADRGVPQAIVKGLSHAHNLCGKTQLADAVDLLADCCQVVTNDSGLMHVAAAVGVRIQALYGSSSPAYTPPLTEQASIHYLGLSCSPCFERVCPLGHTNCLNDLSVERVYQSICVGLP